MLDDWFHCETRLTSHRIGLVSGKKFFIIKLGKSSFNRMKILILEAWNFSSPASLAVQFFRSPLPSCWFWSMQIFRAPPPSPTFFSEPPFWVSKNFQSKHDFSPSGMTFFWSIAVICVMQTWKDFHGIFLVVHFCYETTSVCIKLISVCVKLTSDVYHKTSICVEMTLYRK